MDDISNYIYINSVKSLYSNLFYLSDLLTNSNGFTKKSFDMFPQTHTEGYLIHDNINPREAWILLFI